MKIVIIDYSSLMHLYIYVNIVDCLGFKKVGLNELKKSKNSRNLISILYIEDVLTKNIPKLISSIDALVVKVEYSKNKLIQYLISEGEESINDIIKKAYELQEEYNSLACDLEISLKDISSKDAPKIICNKIKELIKEKLK